MSWKDDFAFGILKGNPVLVLMIGLCPTLAISVALSNAVGMSVAVAFVLIGSNLMVSAIRKLTPDELRIPIFIIVISTFVTTADYALRAFSPTLSQKLGVFVPLIVVNCIIIGRAEAFAYKNTVFSSLLDGIGGSIGFLLVISVIALIREFFGNGSILAKEILTKPATIMILSPGGFITIGSLMGLMNYWNRRRAARLVSAERGGK